MMQLDFTSLLVGAAGGAILAIAIAVPRVGRIVSMILAIVCLVAGVGFLLWAGSSVVQEEELRPLSVEPFHIATTSEAMAVGGGLLIGSLVALGVSFRSYSRR